MATEQSFKTQYNPFYLNVGQANEKPDTEAAFQPYSIASW